MKRFSVKILSVFLVAVMLCAFGACANQTPQPSFAPGETPRVEVTMADGGKFVIELYPQYAPVTVANFISLVESGFYDGLEFHRVTDVLVQGGDAHGMKPEHKIKGEFPSNGYTANTLKHERGVISMARTSDPNSATSQFFVCYTELAMLDGNYAAFGKVVEGMEVLDAFREGEFTVNSLGENAVPVEPIVIERMERIA